MPESELPENPHTCHCDLCDGTVIIKVSDIDKFCREDEAHHDFNEGQQSMIEAGYMSSKQWNAYVDSIEVENPYYMLYGCSRQYNEWNEAVQATKDAIKVKACT